MITTAKGCAWRAVYIRMNGRQVAFLSFDPNIGCGAPTLSGNIRKWSFRVKLPTVTWSAATRNRAWMFLYRQQSKLLHGLDGRFGWGTRRRRA
jgi:hypothetical protein